MQLGTIGSEQGEQGVVVLAVSGEHDLNTAPELRRCLDQQMDAGSAVVVDLSPATFIDSSILGVILEARRRSLAGGPGLAVVNAGGAPAVVRVLEITGLRSELPVHEGLAEAMEAARAGGSGS